MSQYIPNWLKKRAELTPNRVALIFEGERFTFSEIYTRTTTVAGQLTSTGVKNGLTVSVLLSNHADTVVILYALQMLGVKTVILNNKLTVPELIWQMRDSEATVLISENQFNEKLSLIKDAIEANVIKKESLFFLPIEKAAIQEEYDLNTVTTIMYTSGTTGNPKGVLQTYGNHWWSATASALNIGLIEKDQWLCAVPIFHISGYSILMRSLIYGMTVNLHKGFNAKLILEEIEKEQVTIMSVVTTMLLKINEELGHQKMPNTFRCMLLGGGPAPISLLENCRDKQIPVYQTFGMTETSSQFATLAPEYSLLKLGSAGKALFPNQIRIVGEDGTTLSAMEEGEIIVKGPNVTIGYLNREEETKKKIQDGWLHTGDIGYIDDDGFLYVLDRRSDLIISGGENIYPAEVEGILQAHPQIEDAGVVGSNDPKWGKVPVAFIVLKKESICSEQEIIQYCSQKLAKYKVPKRICFVEDLPRNASKKLLRRTLRSWLGEE